MDDDESVVLTFEDTTLVKADLKLLDDGYWLNDKIIGFFYEFVISVSSGKQLHDRICSTML
jgi:Ulp1 family protease